MKYSLLGVLFLVSLPLVSRAGNTHVGNGGNARVCRAADGTVNSIEFFDWWENRGIRPQLVLNLGADDVPYMDKVRLAIGRLARLSPLRASLYLKWAESFNSEMHFVSDDYPLGDPADSDSPFDPGELGGCRTEQLALQLNPKSPWEMRYLVRASLWEKLSQNDKAGLVLHEIIYREANEMSGHQNSVAVRFLNSLMASQVLEGLSLEEFLVLLRTYQFTLSDVNGHWISLGICQIDVSRTDSPALSCSSTNYFPSQLTFFPSGNLQSVKNTALLYQNRAFHPRQIVLGPSASPYSTEQVPYLGLCSAVYFTETGRIRKLCDGEPTEFQKVVVKPYDPFFIVRAVLFDDAERINGILIDENHATPLLVGEKPALFRTGENRIPIIFHPNGRVASGIVSEEEEFPTRRGFSVKLKPRTFATFDPEGYLRSPLP